jgi:hypothetical protein
MPRYFAEGIFLILSGKIDTVYLIGWLEGRIRRKLGICTVNVRV